MVIDEQAELDGLRRILGAIGPDVEEFSGRIGEGNLQRIAEGGPEKDMDEEERDNPFALYDDTPEKAAKAKRATAEIQGCIDKFAEDLQEITEKYSKVGARDTASWDKIMDHLMAALGVSGRWD